MNFFHRFGKIIPALLTSRNKTPTQQEYTLSVSP